MFFCGDLNAMLKTKQKMKDKSQVREQEFSDKQFISYW